MNPYSSIKNACYHCKRRHLNCHDDCPDYKEFRAKVEKAAANERKAVKGEIW